MAHSSLKLIIQKGPRSGETLEFNSRSTIRIGRVVKGNNLTIKDSGISSKHLEIKFNYESLSWVITDLDSSNGTRVNTSELEPFSPLVICHGDEIKIGECTSIRVEIVELKENNRRNLRRQVATKSGNDLRGKVVEGLNLGDNVEIKEEIGNHRNPRRRAASKTCTDLGSKVGEVSNEEENVEIREEMNNHRNPKKQAASKRGHDLGNKVEVSEEGCLNLEEENMEKGVKGNRRGRGRGRPKKVSNVDGASADDELVGVCESVGNVPMKQEYGVSTRRTRSSKRAEEGLLSLAETMPARRTRRAKNVMDAGTGSVMEKVVKSTALDPDECKEIESISVVEDKKARVGRGRKKKVDAESLENIADAVTEGKISHVVLEKENSEKMVDLREQPCDEPVDDPPEQSVNDEMRNEQLMEVEVPEQGDAVAEMKTNHVMLEQENFDKMLDLREQPCDEPVDDPQEQRVDDEMRNEQLMEVEVPEQEGDAVAETKTNQVMLEQEHFDKLLDLSEQPCDELVDDPPDPSVNDVMSEQLVEVEGVSVAEMKISHMMLEKDHIEHMVDVREQPCDEPVDDPPAHNVNDVVKNKQLKEVEVPEQEADALSMREKHCAELMNETNHPSTQRLENLCDGVAKDKMNHEVFEKDVSEKVVDLGEHPCVEPLHDAQGQSVVDVTKNEQFMDVEVTEQEGGTLSMREKQFEELIGEGNQQHDCGSPSVSEQHDEHLMDEPTKCEDCVAGPSDFEEGVCDGVESDAVIDNGKTEESEMEERIDKETEANYQFRCKDPETADEADLENMTLSDWFDFLRVYFPKRIRAATDKIIEDMNKRSAQLDEYMLQQQKDRSSMGLHMEKGKIEEEDEA